MKPIVQPTSLRLILTAAISLTTLSLTAGSAYRAEIKDNKTQEAESAQTLIQQHRNMRSNLDKQAKKEHADVDRISDARIKGAQNIKNRKDRERAISQAKDDRDQAHRDVNARKKARLQNAHEIKKANLKTLHDRYSSMRNGIRAKYGLPIKPVSSQASTPAAKKTTTNTTRRAKANRNKQRTNTVSQPATATVITHTAKTKPKYSNNARRNRNKRARNNAKAQPATPAVVTHTTKTKPTYYRSNAQNKRKNRRNQNTATSKSSGNGLNYGTVTN